MISRTNAAYSPAPMTQVRARSDIGGYGGQGAGGDGGREPPMQEVWGAGAPHAGSLSPREMEAAW
jgi:hypothetical protein